MSLLSARESDVSIGACCGTVGRGALIACHGRCRCRDKRVVSCPWASCDHSDHAPHYPRARYMGYLHTCCGPCDPAGAATPSLVASGAGTVRTGWAYLERGREADLPASQAVFRRTVADFDHVQLSERPCRWCNGVLWVSGCLASRPCAGASTSRCYRHRGNSHGIAGWAFACLSRRALPQRRSSRSHRRRTLADAVSHCCSRAGRRSNVGKA